MIAFLLSVPTWAFALLGVGLGLAWGLLRTNRSRNSQFKNAKGIIDTLLLIGATAMAEVMVVVMAAALGLAFLIALPFVWHDPLGVRVISGLLCTCAGFLAGIKFGS